MKKIVQFFKTNYKKRQETFEHEYLHAPKGEITWLSYVKKHKKKNKDKNKNKDSRTPKK